MPVSIPITPDGARRVTCEIGGKRITFRTYFSDGQENQWLLDLYDEDDTPLIVGISLQPGSNNVIKGQGDILYGFQLYVLAMDDDPTAPNAPGNTLFLLMYAPGEENLYSPGDPLLHLGRTISL